MTNLNLDQLLKPVSPALPAGDNLEYDPLFSELAQAAAGRPERRMGSSVVPEEPPDPDRVHTLATELLGKTKDLRIATLLASATLARSGFDGLGQGLELIRRLLDEFWPSVHPQIDEDDEDDIVIRHSALAGLAAPETLDLLRNSPAWHGGPAPAPTLRELARTGSDAPSETDPGASDASAAIRAVCQAAGAERLRAATAAFERCREQLRAIGETFRKHSQSAGPDLSASDRLLRQAVLHLKPYVPTKPQVDEAVGNEAVPAADTPDATTAQPTWAAPTVPRNRSEVVLMLDRICEYYDSQEPSSPVPLLLRRCQRLCNLPFREILKDLTPVALKELDVIAGKEVQAPARK